MTEQTTTATTAANALTVKTFLEALQSQDFYTVDALLADDLVYENVGFPTLRGGRRVAKMMRGLEGRMGFEVRIHRNVAEGVTVLNERTDAIVLGPFRLQFWVCGVFELHDGQITLWRDYFDLYDMLKGTLRGVAGAVIPSLRPTM